MNLRLNGNKKHTQKKKKETKNGLMKGETKQKTENNPLKSYGLL